MGRGGWTGFEAGYEGMGMGRGGDVGCSSARLGEGEALMVLSEGVSGT